MTAVFSPVRRTFKSQYPSGNSRRHAVFGPASYTQEDMPMGTTANTGQSTWEQIHGGVRETERLIGQKNYNLAMVKARQTLEYMVKCLCERYGILETGLLEMIDALYSAGKSARPPANITTRSARSATRRSMRETTAPTTPIRRITFCRRRSTPSQMTTMTQKNPPGLPEVQLQPPLLPAFAGTSAIPLPALETENLPERVPATPRDAVRAPMQAVRLLNFEALLNQCF